MGCSWRWLERCGGPSSSVKSVLTKVIHFPGVWIHLYISGNPHRFAGCPRLAFLILYSLSICSHAPVPRDSLLTYFITDFQYTVLYNLPSGCRLQRSTLPSIFEYFSSDSLCKALWWSDHAEKTQSSHGGLTEPRWHFTEQTVEPQWRWLPGVCAEFCSHIIAARGMALGGVHQPCFSVPASRSGSGHPVLGTLWVVSAKGGTQEWLLLPPPEREARMTMEKSPF